jgi:hypothetical protein
MTLRKITVEMRAYSMSWVALKAINMTEKKRKVLLLKAVLRFFGILIALPEKRPWYKMMRVNKIGCALMTASVGRLTGPRKLESFCILNNLR